MTCSAPFTSAATRKRAPACASGSSQARPGGYDGHEQRRRGSPRARPAPARGSRASPRREKSGRGTLSGRRTGSRRRTEVTRAPAASAFSHSVAAAIPAPTTTTSSAYSCGS